MNQSKQITIRRIKIQDSAQNLINALDLRDLSSIIRLVRGFVVRRLLVIFCSEFDLFFSLFCVCVFVLSGEKTKQMK